MKTLGCALSFLFAIATCAGAATPPAGQARDDFLDRLAGAWTLTGTMGADSLHQRVAAEWILQDRFLEMHYVQTDRPAEGRPLYEAIYLLGFDAQASEYVLQIFDTFGATYSRWVGVGKRQGNAVEFLWDYPDGRFSNLFTWDPTKGQWSMLLRQKEGTGEWKTFAVKQLVRRVPAQQGEPGQ